MTTVVCVVETTARAAVASIPPPATMMFQLFLTTELVTLAATDARILRLATTILQLHWMMVFVSCPTQWKGAPRAITR